MPLAQISTTPSMIMEMPRSLTQESQELIFAVRLLEQLSPPTFCWLASLISELSFDSLTTRRVHEWNSVMPVTPYISTYGEHHSSYLLTCEERKTLRQPRLVPW